MSYLAINMSGSMMKVYNGAGDQIGKIYPKERFACINQNSNSAWNIKFLNSSGKFINGYCWPTGAQASDWINYAFKHGALPYIGFKTDGSVKVYNSAGKYANITIPAGSFIVPAHDDYTETGTSYPQYMRIRYACKQDGSKVYTSDYGMFIDTGISRSSSNTPVFGNWN